MGTIDIQVAADLDDISETQYGGIMDNGNSVYHRSGPNVYSRQYGGHRWVSGSFPVMSDVIDVCYLSLYAEFSYDMYGYWHFQKAAAPAQFATSAYNISGRARTTANVLWSATLSSGWNNSPSLITPLQEVIDLYSPTAIVAIFVPINTTDHIAQSRAHNLYPTNCGKLHIEWHTPAGGGGGGGSGMAAKLLDAKLL